VSEFENKHFSVRSHPTIKWS